jgi:hypothetical protein
MTRCWTPWLICRSSRERREKNKEDDILLSTDLLTERDMIRWMSILAADRLQHSGGKKLQAKHHTGPMTPRDKDKDVISEQAHVAR